MKISDYKQMLSAQGGVCAICKKPPIKERLYVDKDHQAGIVRGLLCRRCIVSLDGLSDNLKVTRAAISYLLRTSPRRSWDHYFLDIAEAVATRSKDRSNQIGAVIVRDRQILSTGYNGFPTGVNDNLPERHLRPEKYSWVVHAEQNAIFQAGLHGVRTGGATIYVTPLSPCKECAKAIIQAGIKEIVCQNPGVKGQADKEDPAEAILQAARILLRIPD